MRMLSAAEAINPAWERTRQILIAPRSLRLYLKLTSVATLAALANGISFNFNLPISGKGQNPIPPAIMAFLLAGLFFVILIGLLIALVFFYLGSRMQFVLFEVVATRQTFIAPIWRKYGARTWKWIGLKVAIFLGFLVLCLALFAPFLITIFRQTRHAVPGATPTINFVFSIIGFVLAFGALLIIFIAVLYQALDFVLPVMALEDGSISSGWRRLSLIWRHEPGQMLLYLLLRLALGIAFGIAAMTVMLFGLFVAFVPLGGIGFALWYALHAQGIAGHVVLIAAAIMGGLILVSWGFLLYISTVGFVMTFNQAYALYFLGGRYPELGDLLEPPVPMYPYAPPPPTLPPAFNPITPPPPEPAL